MEMEVGMGMEMGMEMGIEMEMGGGDGHISLRFPGINNFSGHMRH